MHYGTFPPLTGTPAELKKHLPDDMKDRVRILVPAEGSYFIMTAKSDILIAGGYGMVGRKMAANLAQDYPNQVVIAGRNVETASRWHPSLARCALATLMYGTVI
jgi:hypothetical protein